MTIYKKGWFDEMAPGLEKIGNALPRLINKNYDAQQALRAALAKDPTLRQKLVNQEALSPGSLEKSYGKEMVGIITGGQADFQTKLLMQLEKPEIQAKIFGDPKKLQGVLKREFGILTDDDVTKDALDITGKQQQNTIGVQEVRAAPARADAQIAQAGGIVIDEKQKVDDAEKIKRISGLVGKGSIRQLLDRNVLSAEDKQVIHRNPELSKQFETESREYWNRQEFALSKERMALQKQQEARMARGEANDNNQAFQLQKLDQQQKYLRAGKIADLSKGKIDIQTALVLTSTPGMTESMLTLKTAPTDAVGRRFWDAAKVVEGIQKQVQADDLADARRSFDLINTEDMNVMRGKERTPEERQAASKRLNVAAREHYGSRGLPVPSYHFDNKNPDAKQGFLSRNKESFYVKPGRSVNEAGMAEAEKWKSYSLNERKARIKALPKAERDALQELLDSQDIKYD